MREKKSTTSAQIQVSPLYIILESSALFARASGPGPWWVLPWALPWALGTPMGPPVGPAGIGPSPGPPLGPPGALRGSGPAGALTNT